MSKIFSFFIVMTLFLNFANAETAQETITKDQAKIQSNQQMIMAKSKIISAKQKQLTALNWKLNSQRFQYGYNLGSFKAVGNAIEINEIKANIKTLNIEIQAISAEIEAYQAENQALDEEIKVLQTN